ncbi:MAG: phosphoribosyltransferase family protein [Flavobacteriales bacterium]
METIILSHHQILNKTKRIAWQIYEDNPNEQRLILAGINGNGFRFAQELYGVLSNIAPFELRLTELKIDKNKPFDSGVSADISKADFEQQTIILIDDVLNSGKTMMYGLKYFLEAPLKKISTAVLIDRNHNRFPIKADYTGTRLSTSSKEHVKVSLESTEYQAVLS